MADDFQDKLNSLMQNPEIMKMVSGMASQMGATQNQLPDTDSIMDSDIANIARIAGKLNSDDDNRIRLLNALKPYMNQTRSANMDMAIKILKLSKITTLF